MKKDFILIEKSIKILTWKARIILVVALLLTLWLCFPLINSAITGYIYHVDKPRASAYVIIENWDGQIDLFSEGVRVAAVVGAKKIGSIIFEDNYKDHRKKQAYILNAWAAGIDTTIFFMIPVPKKDPKTLNIARAVLDTAHQKSWTELTIVTFDLHSARSMKAYLLAAQKYGISIQLLGVPLEEVTSTNWTTTSSGLAMAFSEVIKKLYYDIVVF